MRRLLILLVLLVAACSDTVGGGAVTVEMTIDGDPGFGLPRFAEWELVVRPLAVITIAEAELDGVGVGGSSCAQIAERHPDATGCVEQQVRSIDFDVAPLRFPVNEDGRALIDGGFGSPVHLAVSYPTSVDSLCRWSGSDRLEPGVTRFELEIGIACE